MEQTYIRIFPKYLYTFNKPNDVLKVHEFLNNKSIAIVKTKEHPFDDYFNGYSKEYPWHYSSTGYYIVDDELVKKYLSLSPYRKRLVNRDWSNLDTLLDFQAVDNYEHKRLLRKLGVKNGE